MRRPLISVVTPVYDTDPQVLAECLASVRDQTYGNWEHLLVDDASPADHVWPALTDAAALDRRVVVHRRSVNGGIVAASNDALAMATGDVVVLLDHDDMLTPDALGKVAATFESYPDLDYLYSDEDLLDVEGRRVHPFYKPDWSPERFRAQMYCCHLSAIRRSLLREVGGFREGFDGAQDWDLVFRVTERARRIHHLPEVLYHWRVVPASVLSGEHAKPWAYESARKAIAEHCRRTGIDAEVEELPQRGHFRVRRRVRGEPLVSIVIPTRGSSGLAWGQPRCFVVEAVRSVLHRSSYTNTELVVVADLDTPSEVRAELVDLAGDRLRLIDFERPFHFAEKCNLGAAHAAGEHLLFLNDDVEVVTPDWLETMLGFSQEPDVGAVGCELLFEDGRLQHAGHVYLEGNPGHLMFGRMPNHGANRLALRLDREVSGVTAAAMMCRSGVFDEVGGFSPRFAGNYNDVDLSLKIRSLGYRIVVTPNARLYHFESVTRDPTVGEHELAALRARWAPQLWRDPYYNPNFEGGLDSYPEPVRYP